MSDNNKKCVFCEVQNELIIFENRFLKVLFNLNQLEQSGPAIMIIPQRHIEGLHNLNLIEWIVFAYWMRKIAKFLKKNDIAYNMLVNFKEIATQTINHLHIHFFLRESANDGFIIKRKGRKKYTEKQLESVKKLFSKIFQ